MKSVVKKLLEGLGYRVWHKSVPQRASGNGDVYNEMVQAGFKPSVILDVGANACIYSTWMHMLWPEAKLSLFDPLKSHEQVMADFCKEHPQASYFTFGLGSEDGELEFRETTEGGGETSTFHKVVDARETIYAKRMVPVRTIDSCLAEGLIQQPDIIKIDTEGFEIEVLKGAQKALQGCTYLHLEVNEYSRNYLDNPPKLSEVLLHCESQGYRLHDFFTIAYHPRDGRLWLMDIIMKNQQKEHTDG